MYLFMLAEALRVERVCTHAQATVQDLAGELCNQSLIDYRVSVERPAVVIVNTKDVHITTSVYLWRQ
jgi:hypothetical protein